MRILESYFCLQMIKILLHSKFSEKTWSQRSANLWKTFVDVIKSSDHFLGHLATITSILMNQPRLNSVNFFVYKPSVSQTYRIQTSPSCCRKICIMVIWHEILSFKWLFKLESESYEILFVPWTMICSNLTGCTAKFALLICQGFNSLSTIIS